jgi:hypothetical protein
VEARGIPGNLVPRVVTEEQGIRGGNIREKWEADQ